MAITVHAVLLLIALILFIIAAVGYNPPRGALIPAGLAFLTAAFLFS